MLSSASMDHSDDMHDRNPGFQGQPVAASIESDRFCDQCGYNLRTQPVRREVQTNLLLCRCPECGSFQPAHDGATAGRVWLQRLGTLLLFLWIALVAGVVFGLCAAQVGITFAPLEEATTYRQVTIPAPGAASPTPGPSTVTVVQQGNTTVTRTFTTWRREVRENFPHYTAFMTLMRALSLCLGFVLAMLLAVVLHHWRRWCYLIPVVLVPVAVGFLVWYMWGSSTPHLREWATPHIVAQAAAHLVGGLIGVLLGRPAARLVATLVLPPRLRQVLAFLWLVDGKPLPGVNGASNM